jgi:general secretion pathway protein K
LQARLNINNLTDPDYQKNFERLLNILIPTLGHAQVQAITRNTMDWILPGPARINALSKTYASLRVPYRPAHRPMVDSSEVRLVKGVSNDIYQSLKPYVVTLPAGTKLNIQTAPAEVLMSLSDLLTLDDAKTLIIYRKDKPFLNFGQFARLPVIKKILDQDDAIKQKITFVSQYFLVVTRVKIADQTLALSTLLLRETNNKNQVRFKTIWQTKGAW